MIWSTLFLRLLTILIFFPGILYLLIDKLIPNRFGTMDKFVISLLTTICLSMFFVFDVHIWLLLIGLIIPIAQVALELKSFRQIKELVVEKKFLLQTLIIIPCLEEYIFRFVLFVILMNHDVPVHFYILLSTLTFTFLHFYRLKDKSIYKAPLGFMLAVIYTFTESLFLVIFIHITFNIFTYLIKYVKNYAGYKV